MATPMKLPSLVVAVSFLVLVSTDSLIAQTRPPTASATPDLTKFESSLLGKWYYSGDANRVCYFVNSGPVLFFINDSMATLQMQVDQGGVLHGIRPDYQASCIAVGDYLVWSNGFWFSRKPVDWVPKGLPVAARDAMQSP
jgi:hypothetical protein